MTFLSLLRKNFWLWDPRKGANIVLFAVALLFSISDAAMHFPPAAWGIMLVLMFLLGQAGGASALNTDLQHDNILFLEYLPIRWSYLWLANFLDQFFANVLFVALLVWHRVLFFKPPDPGEDFLSDPILSPLYSSRWLLPVALIAFISASYAYTLFWRTFFRTDKAAIIPNLLGAMVFLSWPIAFFTVMHLVPTISDVVPILLLFALLFAAGSYVAFALPPRYWPRWLRFVTAGIPLVVLLFATEVLIFFASADRWARLDFSEPELHFRTEAFPGNERPYAILTANSFRSGQHRFYWDPSLDSPKYLGRELDPIEGNIGSAPDRELRFTAEFTPNTLWPSGENLLTVRPDGSDARPRFNLNEVVRVNTAADDPDRAGRRYRWADDGSALLIVVEPRAGRYDRGGSFYRPPENQLLVVDPTTGHLRRRFTIERGNYPGYLFSRDGKLLFAGGAAQRSQPSTRPRETPTRLLPTYRLAGIHDEPETTFQPPARVICFADDLTQALCLRSTRSDTDVAHGEILKVDLQSGSQVTLLANQRLGPDAGSDISYDQVFPTAFSLSTEYNPRADVAIRVDDAFANAIWVSQRRDGDLRRLSFIHIDLKTGAHKTIVPESELPTLSITDSSTSTRPPLRLRDFTSDSKMFIYQLGSKLIYLDLASGSVASSIELNSNSSPRFSPSRRRFLLQRSIDSDDDQLPAARSSSESGSYERRSSDRRSTDRWSTECYDHTGHIVILRTNLDSPAALHWLDDDHILLDAKNRITVTTPDGKSTRQLLPPS